MHTHETLTFASFKPFSIALIFALAQGCSSMSGDSGDRAMDDTAGCGPGIGFDLSDYRETFPVTDLAFVSGDLSGITYNPDTDSFYMIQNNGGRIWEVDTSFNLIRTITHNSSFGDSEDIVYLRNDEFAIVSEEGFLYIGIIPRGDSDISIDARDFQAIEFAPDAGNSGPEGVAYDIATQTFYIVKEQNPRRLYSFVRPAGNVAIVTPTQPFNAETVNNPTMTDMSGVVFNPATGRLLILSDLDYRIVDIALDGTVCGKLDFDDYRQYEGITLDNASNIHVVGEPRFFQVWSPR